MARTWLAGYLSGQLHGGLETTIQTIVNLSDDPKMKAIIMNQSVPRHNRGFFRKIKETGPSTFSVLPARDMRSS